MKGKNFFRGAMILAFSFLMAGSAAGKAADYSDPENWAYYGIGENKDVDLFLICPTVTANEENNMSLNDAETKEKFLGGTGNI